MMIVAVGAATNPCDGDAVNGAGGRRAGHSGAAQRAAGRPGVAAAASSTNVPTAPVSAAAVTQPAVTSNSSERTTTI